MRAITPAAQFDLARTITGLSDMRQFVGPSNLNPNHFARRQWHPPVSIVQQHPEGSGTPPSRDEVIVFMSRSKSFHGYPESHTDLFVGVRPSGPVAGLRPMTFHALPAISSGHPIQSESGKTIFVPERVHATPVFQDRDPHALVISYDNSKNPALSPHERIAFVGDASDLSLRKGGIQFVARTLDEAERKHLLDGAKLYTLGDNDWRSDLPIPQQLLAPLLAEETFRDHTLRVERDPSDKRRIRLVLSGPNGRVTPDYIWFKFDNAPARTRDHRHLKVDGDRRTWTYRLSRAEMGDDPDYRDHELTKLEEISAYYDVDRVGFVTIQFKVGDSLKNLLERGEMDVGQFERTQHPYYRHRD